MDIPFIQELRASKWAEKHIRQAGRAVILIASLPLGVEPITAFSLPFPLFMLISLKAPIISFF
jgi:hypothetical protein